MLPALALVVVYFGYIARMTRAGTIQALDADYTRTAVMKGLDARPVMRRHVMRNALQPTVSVIGVQIGYLFGSLVALELIFNYPGLGSLILRRRRPRTSRCCRRRSSSSASSTCSARWPPTSSSPG